MLECHKEIWMESGCIEKGYGYPENSTDITTAYLNTLNLRYVTF